MATFEVSLDLLSVISTAQRRPYWDEYVMTVNLEEHVYADNSVKAVVLASKTGYLGYCGTGGEIKLQPLVAGDGTPWVFNIPGGDEPRDIRMRVLLNNVRGVDKKDIERLVSKLTIIGLEIAAGEYIEAATKAMGVVAAGIYFGVVSALAEEIVNEIFKDRPTCTGTVYEEMVLMTPMYLEKLNYRSIEWAGGRSVAEGVSLPQSQTRPTGGRECGGFTGVVRFSVFRTPTYPNFGTFREDVRYSEIGTIDPRVLHKIWANESSQSSAVPSVKVVIRAGVQPHQDGFDITIVETYHGKTMFFSQSFENAQLTNVRSSVLRNNALGAPRDSSVGIEYIGPIRVPKDLYKKVEKKQKESQKNSPKIKPVDLPDLTFLGVSTLGFDLPGDITLSVWSMIRSVGGGVPQESIVLRYTREANAAGTRTDTWMVELRTVS